MAAPMHARILAYSLPLKDLPDFSPAAVADETELLDVVPWAHRV
jgi:hypothetical protein